MVTFADKLALIAYTSPKQKTREVVVLEPEPASDDDKIEDSCGDVVHCIVLIQS